MYFSYSEKYLTFRFKKLNQLNLNSFDSMGYRTYDIEKKRQLWKLWSLLRNYNTITLEPSGFLHFFP